MAANCHRLARLPWRSQVCRVYHNVLQTRGYSRLCVSVHGIHRVPPPPCATMPHLRHKSVDAAVDSTHFPLEGNKGVFSRFWRWLNDETDEQHLIGQEEREEREAILSRVQDMYFAKPPIQPDLSFYKEAFRLLVKYNDKNGVETLWRLMEEMNIEADAELLTLVEPFLEQARKNVWFQ